jgi:hypothetical protein
MRAVPPTVPRLLNAHTVARPDAAGGVGWARAIGATGGLGAGAVAVHASVVALRGYVVRRFSLLPRVSTLKS